MKSSLLLRFFPPPRYLTMRPVAVDLSDRSVKYCRLSFGGSIPKLDVYGERSIPTGAIEGGRIKNADAVIGVLREVAKDFDSKDVVAALPEEPGFTFVLSLPAAISREGLREAIELQLEEHIPLPASGVIFDYEILREPTSTEGQFQIAVSAFPKDLAADYVRVFTDAGFRLVALESETQAIARSLCHRTERGTVLLVDLGKTHTSFVVAVDSLSVLTSTITEIGGDFFTKMVGKGLGLKEPEAEKLKNERGLLTGKDNSLVSVLLPAISVLRDEISKSVTYWDTQVEQNLSGFAKITKVILCGGQAMLPGLAEYLGSRLGVKVEIGDIWKNLLDTKISVPPITFERSVRNAVVFGLALRSLE